MTILQGVRKFNLILFYVLFISFVFLFAFFFTIYLLPLFLFLYSGSPLPLFNSLKDTLYPLLKLDPIHSHHSYWFGLVSALLYHLPLACTVYSSTLMLEAADPFVTSV